MSQETFTGLEVNRCGKTMVLKGGAVRGLRALLEPRPYRQAHECQAAQLFCFPKTEIHSSRCLETQPAREARSYFQLELVMQKKNKAASRVELCIQVTLSTGMD